MIQHRNPRTKTYINGTRLFAQELYRVKRGLARYSFRAAAVAQDIKSIKGTKSAAQILELERRFFDALRTLEEEVSRHA